MSTTSVQAQQESVAKVNAELNVLEGLIGVVQNAKPFEVSEDGSAKLVITPAIQRQAELIASHIARFNKYASDYESMIKGRKAKLTEMSPEMTVTLALKRGLDIMEQAYEKRASILGNECYSVATVRLTNRLMRNEIKPDEFALRMQRLASHYRVNPGDGGYDEALKTSDKVVQRESVVHEPQVTTSAKRAVVSSPDSK